MAYYEAVWENGEHSVMNSESDDDVISAVMEHDRRARAGEPGGPAGQPANRIVKVLKYKEHPGDFGADGTLSKDEVRELLKDYGDVVNIDQFTAQLRDALSPHDASAGPHDSAYKMPEEGEVALPKEA